jgi:hypothetical protein
MMVLSLLYNALSAEDKDRGVDHERGKESAIRDSHLYVLGNDVPFAIPLRKDVFLLPHVLMTHAYDALFDEGKEHSKLAQHYIADAVWKSVTGMPMIPTMIRAPLENITNYDFYTGRPVEGMGVEGKEPGERWVAGTSETSKMVGGALNVSPIKIDHFVQGFFGSVGGAVLGLADSALRVGMGLPSTEMSPQELMRKVPGVAPFTPKETGGKNLAEYYMFKEESDKLYATMKSLEVSPEKYREYIKEHGNMVGTDVRKWVSKVDQTLSKIREAEKINAAMPDKERSPAEKRALKESLEKQRMQAVSGIRQVQENTFK